MSGTITKHLTERQYHAAKKVLCGDDVPLEDEL
jgi:hypothetical protein